MEKNDLKTKDRILLAAIDLFAKQGYKDVSMRELAKQIGIKASSLYKHYAGKQQILSSIFELFRQMMDKTAVSGDEAGFGSMTPKQYLDAAYELFKQVMWTPQMMKVAKIIAMEQQRGHDIGAFFVKELIDKPNDILQQVIEQMIANGTIEPVDARAAAEEYNAYIVYLYFEQNFLQGQLSLEQIDAKMKRHNEFFAQYILKCKGERQ